MFFIVLIREGLGIGPEPAVKSLDDRIEKVVQTIRESVQDVF